MTSVLTGIACRLLAVSLFLPMGETVRTDCFRNPNGDVPANVSGAEVTRTEEALVVRVWRRLSPGEQPRARGRAQPPESMFDDGGETVEVLVAPHADEPTVYYHFIVNPSNVLYSARRRDASWRPAVPVASRTFFEGCRWGVTLTLPYAAFGVGRPADGVRWGANFAAMSCSWTGVRDFHDRSTFGELVFGGIPAAATVEAVARDADGTVHVSFAIPPRRQRGEIPHKGGGFSCDYVLSETGRPVAGFKSQTVGHDAAYLILDRFYYPVAEPFDIVYAAKNMGMSTVRIRRLQDDAVFGERRDLPPAGTFAVEPLPVGEYAFEIDDGNGRASCQFEVCDANRLVQAAGPRYPIVGSERLPSAVVSFGSAVPKRYVRLPTSGYVFDCSEPDCGAGRLLKSVSDDTWIGRIAYEAQMDVWVQDGSGKAGEKTDGESRSAKDGPAFYRSLYHELKRRYPGRRFSLHVDDVACAAEYATACDVFEYAANGCSYAPNMLDNLRGSVDDMLAAADGRPAFFWLGVAVPDGGRSRTAEELNAAIRYCVLKGVAGNVFHLGHGGIPASNTRLWSFMRGCERAVNIWHPDWATGKDVPVTATACEDLAFGLRANGARRVLIAVNFSRFERTLSYEDHDTHDRRSLRLPGCGSAVVMWDGGR